MNKLILGLLAAATLSTAALANGRTEEGMIASRNLNKEVVYTDSEGLAAKPASGDTRSDFSIDPVTGVRDGNDSK